MISNRTFTTKKINLNSLENNLPDRGENMALNNGAKLLWLLNLETRPQVRISVLFYNVFYIYPVYSYANFTLKKTKKRLRFSLNRSL